MLESRHRFNSMALRQRRAPHGEPLLPLFQKSPSSAVPAAPLSGGGLLPGTIPRRRKRAKEIEPWCASILLFVACFLLVTLVLTRGNLRLNFSFLSSQKQLSTGVNTNKSTIASSGKDHHHPPKLDSLSLFESLRNLIQKKILEAVLDPKPPPKPIWCPDGSKGFLNDNYCDCSDGSDETETSACSHILVNKKTFVCKDGNGSVFTSRVSDGVKDCSDGSDETPSSLRFLGSKQ